MGAQGSLPSGGRGCAATAGGASCRRCERTPPLPAASPPQGGENIWSSRQFFHCWGERLRSDRGVGCRRCGRTPPLPAASPPQGGRKFGVSGNSSIAGGRGRAATAGGRPPALWAYPPSACGISPPRGGENLEPPRFEGCRRVFGIFSPSVGGGVAQRQRGAGRRRCGRTPLCLRHLPPRGGENLECPAIPPLPGGGCAATAGGGLPALRAYPPSACGIPPQGGRTLGSDRRVAKQEISPPALRGEMSQRDRGGATTRRKALHPPACAAGEPPLCLTASPPPKGERKLEQPSFSQRGAAPPLTMGG